jgi:hypothetical protein
VENVQYPADWLADGGPPFEDLGLRQLPGPLTDYAAITLVRDSGTYAWRVEDAERKANS